MNSADRDPARGSRISPGAGRGRAPLRREYDPPAGLFQNALGDLNQPYRQGLG